MQEPSEEKRLPASEHKLTELRRKGQVSQSRDLVAGATLFATLAYLLLAWPTIWSHILELVETVARPDARAFSAVSEQAMHHAFLVVILLTAPLVGIVVLVALAFGIMATRGLVFSADTIKPKVQHIDPGQGLKRIASLRNVVEFAKGLIKVVLLAGVFVFVLSAWLGPLFKVPTCGEACLGPMVLAVFKPLAIAAALAFLVIGFVDLPVQRWLFLRDKRMTQSEAKRERKSFEGDPSVRSELKRQRRQAATRRVKVGLRNAKLVLVDGDRLVALRYVRGETAGPAVVAKAKGAAGDLMISQAHRLELPVFKEPELLAALHRTPIGDYVPSETFPQVARLFARLGQI